MEDVEVIAKMGHSSLDDLAAKSMRLALGYAIEKYGKDGGPWNVPGSKGSWIEMARTACELFDDVQFIKAQALLDREIDEID